MSFLTDIQLTSNRNDTGLLPLNKGIEGFWAIAVPFPTLTDVVKLYLASDIEKYQTPEIPRFSSSPTYITD